MITSKDIIQQGHISLQQVAKEVTFPLNDENKKVVEDLMTYLKNSLDDEIAEQYELRAGVGLAAPQINKLVRIFAINIPKGESTNEFKEIFINPKIVAHSEKMVYIGSGEGCLSVDENISGFVPRYQKLTVEYYNINGEKQKKRLKNYEAVVFQHEFDHLNGILFTEKIVEDISNLTKI